MAIGKGYLEVQPKRKHLELLLQALLVEFRAESHSGRWLIKNSSHHRREREDKTQTCTYHMVETVVLIGWTKMDRGNRETDALETG